MSDYKNCRIVNIRRGSGKRSHLIYAELVNDKDELLIGATLDYIVKALAERIPIEENEAFEEFSTKPSVKQSIVGESLTATIGEVNCYTRTLNNIFLPKMKNNEYYRLILDYENPELKSFTMDLNRETLKGLADFINNYLENK